MVLKKTQLLAFILTLLLLFGCGKNEQQEQMEEAANQLEEAGKQMAELGEQVAREGVESVTEGIKKMSEAINAKINVEPVDFRDLKDLLPNSLPGLQRIDASGERTKAFGINVSQTEGIYESRNGDSSINIKITDMGSIKGLSSIATLGWTMAEIDRESDSGYEKTSEYSGHKMFEEYNTIENNGKAQVLVAQRFMIEVDGDNVRMREIQGALDRINIKKLEKMKDFGIQE